MNLPAQQNSKHPVGRCDGFSSEAEFLPVKPFQQRSFLGLPSIIFSLGRKFPVLPFYLGSFPRSPMRRPTAALLCVPLSKSGFGQVTSPVFQPGNEGLR